MSARTAWTRAGALLAVAAVAAAMLAIVPGDRTLVRAADGGACGGVGGTIRTTTKDIAQQGGGTLPAKLFAPDASLLTGDCPAISMLPGGGAPISSVEWAATRLAANGYVVIITDPASNTTTSYDIAAKSGIDCLVSSCNTYLSDTDTDAIGVAGWSLGGRSLTKTQETDARVDAVVEWDNLALSEDGDEGSPACSNTPGIVRDPRVPAMGQASVSCTKPIDAKKTAYHHWRSYGVESMEVVFAGCDHFCWSAAAGATQHDRNHYYTQAWFDRWLKGDVTATARLVARTVLGVPVGTLLATSYNSAAFFDGYDCETFQTSCSAAPTSTPTATPTATPTPIPACTAGNTGWLSPASQAADSGGDGDGFESNATSAFADGGGVASNRNGGGDRHRYYSFGVSIPAGCAIKGIELRLDWYLDSSFGDNSISAELSWNGGASWTAAKTDVTETTSEHTATLGGASDLWGRSWTASDLSNSNLRVRVTSNSPQPLRDFYLDWVPVRITYGP